MGVGQNSEATAADVETVLRARGGDRTAFAELVRRYGQVVLGLCRGMTSGSVDAEDLAHDTFIDAYLKLGELRDPARFLPWLRQIAVNHCRMWHRRERRQLVDGLKIDTALDEGDGEIHTLPREAAHPDRLLDMLIDGLEALPRNQRLALELQYGEGLSYVAIAGFLDIPIGTVMSRLHRAKRQLKRRMETMADQDEPKAGPDRTLRQSVDAEIAVLTSAFAEDESRQRLRVMLEHSPERFEQVIRQVSAEDLGHLAVLMGTLGSEALRIAFDLCFSEVDEYAAQARELLRHMIGARYVARKGIVWELPLRPEATRIMDLVVASGRTVAEKVALVIDLLPGSEDAATQALMLSVLLCYEDEAFELLLERWRAEGLEAPAWVAAALRRTNDRLLASQLQPLSGRDVEVCHLAVALLQRFAHGAKQRWRREASALEKDLEIRARGTLYREDLDERLLEETVMALRALLEHGHRGIREGAANILGELGVVEAAPALRALLAHDLTSTRLAGVQAVMDVQDRGAAAELTRLADSEDPGERRAAVQALGVLGADGAHQVLLQRATDVDGEVAKAAIIALGEVENQSPEIPDRLRELSRSADKQNAKAAASALYGGVSKRQPTRLTRDRLQKIRGDAEPPLHISPVAVIRSLPESRPYAEKELTRLIGQVCNDFSATRRYLVMGFSHGSLMSREQGIYRLTPLGEAVWRVEHFIEANYRR